MAKIITPRPQQCGRPSRNTTWNELKPAGQEERALVVRNTGENLNNNGPRDTRPPFGRDLQGQANRYSEPKITPPRHLSRHPVINGSKTYRREMGDLCLRCGDLGHRRPNCRAEPLEPWEQDYLKESLYQGLKSNFAGFGSGSGSLRFRDIQNSNWRNKYEEPAMNPNQRSRETPERKDTETKENIRHLTYQEFDDAPLNERSSRSAQSMSVIIGFDEERRPLKASAKPQCDEGLTLESYLNMTSQKKRPRPMNIEDLLNDEEQTAKIQKKSTRRQRRAVKQLREIVGRQGQGPVNYK
ncbi:hypothetical protein K3495_g16148, partial [Podosphaera aphanis]